MERQLFDAQTQLLNEELARLNVEQILFLLETSLLEKGLL
jgi:hypothetical protein